MLKLPSFAKKFKKMRTPPNLHIAQIAPVGTDNFQQVSKSLFDSFNFYEIAQVFASLLSSKGARGLKV